MSKPEPPFNFFDLQKLIKLQLHERWRDAQTKSYDKKKWGELQANIDDYFGHVKRLLRLDKL